MATSDNIRVAIRVRPLIKRENDLNNSINWKVEKNTISQVSNGKIVPHSSFIFDRIFDTSNSTQDVYDEFGKPTVQSAMDGFNGTLFAYGQTSSGKTYTMMGDQQNEGVIPKAVGEIYDYIQKHPSREFLMRVSYMEIYNEDIKDLLNPSKTNLKIHENAQRQVYVGDLTEEVVSCPEDVFKHMMRGEKNRHFGETNMNDRSSRSHTIFRVVIESREMKDESKDPEAIDGAVRVAHLNLVDLAGSERASQTGAFGQRLKEGGHINRSLLTLGSVIAKLSEGESFIPFRDSKLTRILQSSLGGNAKTSMICTITPAAIEESISTLKFASRAKTIKNCPEVNEVLDDGTLLKRYRKEISELKKQLVEMSSKSHVQELQLEKEKVNEMEEMLEQQRRQQNEQKEKIKKLCDMICSAGGETGIKPSKARMAKRRETWCPGALLANAPLASAAARASNPVQVRLARISSSPSSEESEFDEMSRDAFLSTLEEEEERKTSEDGRRKVAFASPRAKRCLSPVMDTAQEDKEMQTEPDEKTIHLELEIKKLRKELHEAIQTRDLYNELLEESNTLLEKMSTETGRAPAPTNSDITLKYVAELRNEKVDLETQVSVLKTKCQDLENLKARNKELEDEIQSLEDERTLSNDYLSELQAEFESVQAEKQALTARVEGLGITGALDTAAKIELDSLQMKLEESEREKTRLEENLDFWREKHASLESDVARLQNELVSTADENCRFEERLSAASEEGSVKVKQLEIEVKELKERLSNVNEQERVLTQVIEEKSQWEKDKKLEVDSLQMVLEERTQEKERLQEKLESWNEKYASLERDVARLQNELALAVEEKCQFEERLSAASEEGSMRTKELEGQVNQLKERLSNVDEQKQMLTQVIEEKLQLEESKKMEVDSLQMVLEERTQEKERLQENLKSWRDKYSSLESDVAQLHNELASAVEEKFEIEGKLSSVSEQASLRTTELEAQVKQLEERLSIVDEQERRLNSQLEENKKQEFDSLQIVLEERTQEKERLQENLESWREKYANLESDVKRLQNELVSAVEEKSQIEEKLSSASEKASIRVRELEIQVKHLEKSLCNVDEQEQGLTQVTEENLQLEENKKTEVDSLQVILEERTKEKERLQDHLESWKEKYATLESDVTRLQNELTSAVEEKRRFEERLSCASDEDSERTRELEIQVKQLEERLSNVEEQEQMLTQVIEQKLQLEENVEHLKAELVKSKENYETRSEELRTEKETEIAQLTKELELVKEQLQTSSCEFDGKDVIQQKRDVDAKVSDLEVQLERIINEKKECEQTIDRVKKERDEIKNDLSESITDNAELQKDLLEIQQKVKRYKDHIRELENELEQRAAAVTTYEQKTEDLQCELNSALYKNDTSFREMDDTTRMDEQTEREKLASLLTVEKERAQALTEQCNSLKSSLETLRNRNEVLDNEAENTKREVEEQQERIKVLESQLIESKQTCDLSKEQLHEEIENCEKLVKELKEYKSNECRSKDTSANVSFEVELQKAKKQCEELGKELAEEKKLTATLTKEHSSLAEELQHLKDSLLRDTNRGMDQQRVIDKMKAERRETICVQAHQRQELERDLCEAEKKVSELESQCTFLKSEKDLLEHRLEVANNKVEETRQEMRDMENLYSSHNTRTVTQLGDDKAMQKIKQMEFSIDLTKQKCDKAERRVKELENENRQLKGADIRNGALMEERDSLKQQVQQAKQLLDEKTKKLNEISIEVTQLKAHVDKLSEENKKHRCLIEKKDNKIDNLEQKLWETEEELKLQKERGQEQQLQESALEELNTTIRTKHEELEHMTFLVDEKDIEIAEVRSSLQENEFKQLEMVEKSRQNEERIRELENELSDMNKNLQYAKNGREEANAKILELKEIIQQQESELISTNEKIESRNIESKAQSQELSSKNEKLESDLQEMEHKLLEVETELEFTKNSLDKVDAEKEGLNKQIKKALEEKEMLEVKLRELQTSFERQNAATDDQINELHKSVLNEKELVVELEDKVLRLQKSKDAIEEELRRVLGDQQGNVSKEEMEAEISAVVNSENVLRQEIEKEKEKNAQLEIQVEKLAEEKNQLESLAQSHTVTLEEEKKRLEEEMARVAYLCEELEKAKAMNAQLETEGVRLTEENDKLGNLAQSKNDIIEEERRRWKEAMAQFAEQFEEEKTQLKEQIKISALKVRESEDCFSEKDEKIKDLETRLATATKSCTDYEQSVEYYQMKSAKAEYELDNTVARLAQLEEQKSSNATDANEIESLRKECEAAKKKAKNTLEKYFSESDRLKAIIDEMQDEEEDFVRQIDELKKNAAKKDAELSQLRVDLAEMKKAQDSARPVDHSELESLRKECEAAKMKTKKTLEKYFSESDRLKAIIDEQQEIIDKAENVREAEDKMEATRIELAQKNMQLQSLQYDLYKLQEKYDKETTALTKEVEWGREKVGSLKLEIRRLKETEPDDTISIIRGQPVALKKKEDSDVGVISNVAVYSLKAKVGKLESENQKLSEKVQQLEREKATLSLLNTESSNQVTQLKSENKALKKKRLIEEKDIGGRPPEVPKETLVKEKEKKENFQNWLSDASNNMTMNAKEDEPNQCANQ